MPKPVKRKAATARAAKQTAATGGAWAQWFERAPGERRYWLVKSEPSTFSFDDLWRAPRRTTGWDGVRNHVARNFLRDGMKVGDQVFFYHSSAEPPAVIGICEVVREAYPDPTALDKTHEHFDPASDPAQPTWYQVDLRAVERLKRPVSLPELRQRKELAGMALLRIGRLSVTPVSQEEWRTILEMGN